MGNTEAFAEVRLSVSFKRHRSGLWVIVAIIKNNKISLQFATSNVGERENVLNEIFWSYETKSAPFGINTKLYVIK